jgi:hypothetical protein
MEHQQRIATLQELIAEDPTDPFPRYGLCLEYQRIKHPEAPSLWKTLLNDFPRYLPSYYQAGMALHASDQAFAETIWQQGISLATELGDKHALAELKSILLNSQLGELDL